MKTQQESLEFKNAILLKRPKNGLRYILFNKSSTGKYERNVLLADAVKNV